MREVYLNGSYVPLEDAKVPVMDRGFLFGDGVYEVVPLYGGVPFHLDRHLERLDHSLASIRMENPLSREAWGRILARVAGGPSGNDQLAYLQVTRGGDAIRNHLFPTDVPATVLVMAWDARPRSPEVARTGISAISLEDPRWLRCDIKSTSLLSNVLLRQAAADAGADESILLRDGSLTEGSASNVLMVSGGEIATPPKSGLLLSGITRDLVLELAREAGVPCAERGVSLAELRAADEIWISSSSRELMPVTRLDDKPVGDGAPGPLWRRMDELFQAHKAATGSPV